VGWKRLLRFPEVTTQSLRVSLNSEAPCLAMGEIGFYKVMTYPPDPMILRGGDGKVRIEAGEAYSIRYALKRWPEASDFQDYTGPFALPYGEFVSAYAYKDDLRSETTLVRLDLERTGWKVVAATGQDAKAALDGDPTTLWVSDGIVGDEESPEQSITVDLGKELILYDFTYLPRQDGKRVGMVDRYRVESSLDGETWELATEGEFSNILNNPVKQEVWFKRDIAARYLRFTPLRVAGDPHPATAAEIGARGKAK
jgi:alpha-L-fucosidase